MSQDPRDATIYGRAVIEEAPASFEEVRAASLSPSAAFGDPVDPVAADDGSDWGDPPPSSNDDSSSSDEGAPVGVDANIVEVSDDAAAVSDEEPPPPPIVVPPVADVPAPTPSKLAAFMASTPNPTSPTA